LQGKLIIDGETFSKAKGRVFRNFEGWLSFFYSEVNDLSKKKYTLDRAELNDV